MSLRAKKSQHSRTITCAPMRAFDSAKARASTKTAAAIPMLLHTPSTANSIHFCALGSSRSCRTSGLHRAVAASISECSHGAMTRLTFRETASPMLVLVPIPRKFAPSNIAVERLAITAAYTFRQSSTSFSGSEEAATRAEPARVAAARPSCGVAASEGTVPARCVDWYVSWTVCSHGTAPRAAALASCTEGKPPRNNGWAAAACAARYRWRSSAAARLTTPHPLAEKARQKRMEYVKRRP
mmetsp:Transcript_50496/g.127298  ORF Transcript_50496/g.127298 Transcript_50496/m.127298 type:complete len:241 (+) Transcript_50496:259-981(+)